MTDTHTLPRITNAQDILKEHDHNEWDGSLDLTTLVRYRYAVVVSRSDDSWVLGADSAQDIAEIVLSLMADNESLDAEWLDGVYSIDTGLPVMFGQSVAVTIEIDGDTATATSR